MRTTVHPYDSAGDAERAAGALAAFGVPSGDIELVRPGGPPDALTARLGDAGMADADARAAAMALAGGRTLVIVRVDDARHAEVGRILRGDEHKIELAQERLVVSTRAAESGGVRVSTSMVERAIEEQVRLREDALTVERRPVGVVATEVPADAFQERSIEVRGMREEAVVRKDVRLVEEIVLRKVVSERTETVRATVRETKVEIDERLGLPPA